jgi:deferrochelatase/peroxidase EfeB
LQSANENDFDFSADPSGTNVPRSAHIRKSNIRQGGSLAHIMRRGIAYGEPFRADADPNSAEGANQERGLLFLCYQASITAQFEFIQTAWVNNPNFPQANDGVDPIIGQAPSCPLSVPGWQPISDVPRFVRTRASVYLFSPSFTSLRYIANLLT